MLKNPLILTLAFILLFDIKIANAQNKKNYNDFCSNNSDTCIITNQTQFQNQFIGCGLISTEGNVIIDSDHQVEFIAKRVKLNIGFSAKIGSTFKASILHNQDDICNDNEIVYYDYLPVVTDDVELFVLQGNKWNSNTLTYSIENSTNDLSQSDQVQAIEEALNVWAEVSSITFTEVAIGGDIRISFQVGDHGDNCAENSCVFDGSGGVLAHAFYPPPNGSLAGDCHFDDAEQWTVNFRQNSSSPRDLLTVAIHEIGHSLGISHSSDISAVMYARYSGSKRVLSQDDVNAIQALYPPPVLPNWLISYGSNTNWTTVNSSGVSFERLRMGDFDGDGKSDIYTTVGGRWYISSSANQKWMPLATSNASIQNIKVGDFNGDGIDDIFYTNGSTWQVSYSATSAWQIVNGSNGSIENIKIGDFNGDGQDDIFYTNGSTWQISYSATSTWQIVNGSNASIQNIKVGDFNGDGQDDIFYTNGSTWQISYSATSTWQVVNGSNASIQNIKVGDFDGDGQDDIFYTNGSTWQVSYSATSNWEIINVLNVSLGNIIIGDFNGDGKDDVFTVNP